MIIRQTTTIIFEYPQDYLQEQEWCKTKEERWVHKSTDTLGAVYENTISYCIGQPSSSEKPNNCEEPQYEMGMGTLKCDNCSEYGSFKCTKCDGEMYFKRLEPKDEPQTDVYDYKGNGKRERSE